MFRSKYIKVVEQKFVEDLYVLCNHNLQLAKGLVIAYLESQNVRPPKEVEKSHERNYFNSIDQNELFRIAVEQSIYALGSWPAFIDYSKPYIRIYLDAERNPPEGHLRIIENFWEDDQRPSILQDFIYWTGSQDEFIEQFPKSSGRGDVLYEFGDQEHYYDRRLERFENGEWKQIKDFR